MVREWLEDGVFLYVMAGICGVGVMLRLLLSLHFGRLLRKTAAMDEVYGGWALRVRREYEECVRVKGRLNSVDIFVDKCVGAKRMAGIMLSTWDRFCGQALLLNAGVLLVTGISGIFYQVDKELVLFTFFIGIWLIIANLVVDNLSNFEEKEEQLKRNLKDYFENRIDCSEELLYAGEAPEEEREPEDAAEEISADGTQAEQLAKAIRAMKDAEKQKEGSPEQGKDTEAPAVSGKASRRISGNMPEEDASMVQKTAAQGAAAEWQADRNSASKQEAKAADQKSAAQETLPVRTSGTGSAVPDNSGAGIGSAALDGENVSKCGLPDNDFASGAAAKHSELTEKKRSGEGKKDKLVSFSEKAGRGLDAAGEGAEEGACAKPAAEYTEGKKAGKGKKESRKAAAAQKKREQIKRQLLMEMERDERTAADGRSNAADQSRAKADGEQASEAKAAAGRSEAARSAAEREDGVQGLESEAGAKQLENGQSAAKQTQSGWYAVQPDGATENTTFPGNAAEQNGNGYSAEKKTAAGHYEDAAEQPDGAEQERRKLWQDEQWREAREQTAAASEGNEEKQLSIEEAAAFLAAEIGRDQKNSKLIEDVLKEFLF